MNDVGLQCDKNDYLFLSSDSYEGTEFVLFAGVLEETKRNKLRAMVGRVQGLGKQ